MSAAYCWSTELDKIKARALDPKILKGEWVRISDEAEEKMARLADEKTQHAAYRSAWRRQDDAGEADSGHPSVDEFCGES
jgi:hypothetical protein